MLLNGQPVVSSADGMVHSVRVVIHHIFCLISRVKGCTNKTFNALNVSTEICDSLNFTLLAADGLPLGDDLNLAQPLPFATCSWSSDLLAVIASPRVTAADPVSLCNLDTTPTVVNITSADGRNLLGSYLGFIILSVV